MGGQLECVKRVARLTGRGSRLEVTTQYTTGELSLLLADLQAITHDQGLACDAGRLRMGRPPGVPSSWSSSAAQASVKRAEIRNGFPC